MANTCSQFAANQMIDADLWEMLTTRVQERPFTAGEIVQTIGVHIMGRTQMSRLAVEDCVTAMLQRARRAGLCRYDRKLKRWVPTGQVLQIAPPMDIGTVHEVDHDPHSSMLTVEFASATDATRWANYFRTTQVTEEEMVAPPKRVSLRPRSWSRKVSRRVTLPSVGV